MTNYSRRVMSFRAAFLAIVFYSFFAPSGLQAETIRLSFTGTQNFISSVLESDAPFAVGDQVSGFLIYDSDAPVTGQAIGDIHDNAISFLSLTYEGIGTLIWDATLLPPGESFLSSIEVLDRGFGTEVAWVVREFAPGRTGTGWRGSPELLSFASSQPGATSSWQVEGFRIGMVLSELLPQGTLPTKESPTIFTPSLTQVYHSAIPGSNLLASGSGRLSSFDLTAIPEPNTVLMLLSGLGLLATRRKRKQRR